MHDLSKFDLRELNVVSWSLCLNTALELYQYKFSSTVIRHACVNGANVILFSYPIYNTDVLN